MQTACKPVTGTHAAPHRRRLWPACEEARGVLGARYGCHKLAGTSELRAVKAAAVSSHTCMWGSCSARTPGALTPEPGNGGWPDLEGGPEGLLTRALGAEHAARRGSGTSGCRSSCGGGAAGGDALMPMTEAEARGSGAAGCRSSCSGGAAGGDALVPMTEAEADAYDASEDTAENTLTYLTACGLSVGSAQSAQTGAAAGRGRAPPRRGGAPPPPPPPPPPPAPAPSRRCAPARGPRAVGPAGRARPRATGRTCRVDGTVREQVESCTAARSPAAASQPGPRGRSVGATR